MTRTASDCTLLIVDDEVMIRDAISQSFLLLGMKVLTAENGNAALATIAGNRIDLIISDLRMPGGDGLLILAELRRLGTTHLPVIMITGSSDLSENDFIERGASCVLTKPFNLNDLRTKVAELLNLS